jgi:enoyl-CoA hydratase/carnithine racemase
MPDLVLTRAEPPVAALTLNRPEKRNALSAEVFAALGEAVAVLARPGIRAAVVAGEGPVFCAGIDVSALAGSGIAPDMQAVARLQQPFLDLERSPVPTVCAIQGAALGAGLELALACDLRICAEDAVFALPEIEFGIVCDLGGIHRAVRDLGPARARDLVLTGRRIDAAQALQTGLVSRVVPPGEVLAAAHQLATELAEKSPRAIAADRRLLDEALLLDAEGSLRRAREEQLALMGGHEFAESVSARLTGRKPVFSDS